MSFSGSAGRNVVSVAATAFLIVVLGLGVLPAGAQQTLVETDAANSNGFAPCPTTVSDLLLNLNPTSSASTSSPTGQEGTGTSWSLLTDGSFGTVGGVDSTYVAIGNDSVLTYMFTGSTGYTITNIDTYSGWRDAGRINQDYTLYYSTVANPSAWIQLNSVNYSAPGTTGNGATNSTQVDLAGTLTGVAGLQFDFGAQQNSYVGYREITVTGSPLAPPTPSAGLGGFSMALIGSGNQDANVGLNANKTYINAVNLNGGTLTINGVNFSGGGGGGLANPTGGNYSITGNGGAWGPNPTSTITGQLGTLLQSFVYNGNPEQLTVSGLTPGQTYVTTLYEAAWDPAGQRVQNITASSGPSTTYDQDMGATSGAPNNAGSLLRYTFVASGTSETLTVSPQNSGYTLHTYGFTTEQVFNNAWTGAASSNWNDANWTVATPNYAGANAFFPASATGGTVNLDQPTTVGHVQFDGTNSWTVAGGNTLTLQTDVGGVSVLASLAGTHTIATPVSMQNNAYKFGNGTLVLSNSVASNGYAMTVSAGTLQFGDGVTNTVPVPFDGNITNNAGLVFNAPNAQTYAGVISGSGGLTMAGAGLLTLNGIHTYTGATVISSGTLQLLSPVAVPVVNSGFEQPAYGATGWAYLGGSTDGVTGGWTFSNYAGIANNGAPWVNVAPQGTQVAFIQSANGTNGSMSQTITSTTDRVYTISFEASNRPGYSANNIVLTVDGTNTVANWNYTQFNNGASFNTYSATVELTPGTHSLTFSGSDVGAADVATAIDNVQILSQGLLPATTAVNLTSAGATLDLGGNNQTIGSLAGVASTVVLNNGSLTAGGDNSNQTFAGNISGAGSFTKAGSGLQVHTGNNTYSGGTTVSGGTLQLATPTALPSGANTGNLNVNGTLDLYGNNASANALNGAGRIDTTAAGTPVLTVGNNNASGSFGGTIQNTAGLLSLVKTGTGTQVLGNTNTYGGGTTIQAGTLLSNAANATGSGAVTVAASATWDIGLNSHTIAGLSGAGTVTSNGFVAGPVYFSTNAGSGISTANTYTHLLDFNNTTGTGAVVNGVQFTAAGTSGSNWTLSGATAPFSGSTGNFVSDGGTGTGMNQLFSDFLYGGNPGVLTLTGLVPGQTYEAQLYNRQFGGNTNDRWQTMTFSAGSGVSNQLVFDEDSSATPAYESYTFVAASSSMTISDAPQNPSNTYHWYGMSLQLVSTALQTLTIGDANNYTYSGVINGGFALIKQGAGTQVLTGANTYTGGTTVSAGTLQLGDGATSNGSVAGNIANNAALVFANPSAQAYSGAISGSGGLTKTGAGTLMLTGVSTYTGPTVISGGALQLCGSVVLTDNFNAAGNPNTGNLNYNLANRQTGSSAPQSWTGAGNSQVGNPTNVGQPNSSPNYLLLAFGGNASLQSLALSSSTVSGPLKVSFDMFPGWGGNGTDWTSFALTSSASYNGSPVVPGAGDFGFLYCNNTSTQEFNNGVAIDGQSSTSGSNFSFYLADNSGAGSPFDGNGTRLVVMNGANLVGSYTLSQGMTTAYLSFMADGAHVGGVQNLFVAGQQVNQLSPSTPVSLTQNGASLVLDNVNQQVAALNGVAGSSISILPFSTLNVAGSGAFAGVISGPFGSVVKSGSGTLTLSSANTYGGGTTLQGGTLNFTNGALSTGPITFTGGTLQYAAGNVQDVSAQIHNSTAPIAVDTNGNNVAYYTPLAASNTGGLTKLGAGTLTLGGGVHAYSGPTQVLAGTLQLAGNVATGPFPTGAAAHYAFEGNTLDSSGNGNNGTLTGTPATATYAAGQFGQALSLNGSQSVVVPNSASLQISGDYTVSAWFNLNSAGMSSNVNGILGTRFGDEGTFDLKVNGPGQSIHGDVGSGGGAWINTGVDMTGLSISAGTWYMVTYVVTPTGAQLYFDGVDKANYTWTTATPVFMNANTQMQIGQSSGGEFMNGSIDDVYVYPSALTAAQVAALYGNVGNLPATTPLQISNSGTFDLNGQSQTVASLGDYAAGGGTVTNSSSLPAALTLTPTGGMTTFSGSITDNYANGGGGGPLSLVVNGPGTQVLAGSSSYGGGTTVTGGATVQISANANLGAGTGALTLNNGTLRIGGASEVDTNRLTTLGLGGGTLDITNTSGGGAVFNGQITGSGSLTKTSAGLAEIGNANNNYQGGTNVLGGTLLVDYATSLGTGAVNVSGGTLDVSTAGLSGIASFTIGGAATLNLSVGNLLISTGSASLNGTLNLSNLNGLSSGTTELMGYLSESGSFSSYTPLPANYNLVYNLTQLDVVFNNPLTFSGSATWISTGASMNWSSSGNWVDNNHSTINAAPGVSGRPVGTDTATFNGTETATSQAINLDVPVNLAALSLSGSNYTLSGSALTLESTSGTATVNVTGGTQTIASAVEISGGSLAVTVSNSGVLAISGNISDDNNSRSLTLTGDGTGELILSGTNTYGNNGGGTVVDAGTLIATNSNALPDGSSLTVGAGGVFIFDPMVTVPPAAVVSGEARPAGMEAVPEPGTLALVAVAGIVAAAAAWRKRRS